MFLNLLKAGIYLQATCLWLQLSNTTEGGAGSLVAILTCPPGKVFIGWYIQDGGFPGGSVVKNLPANAGDAGSIPESGRLPGDGNDNPIQYSYLGNSTDRGAWRATVCGVAKSRIQLTDWKQWHKRIWDDERSVVLNLPAKSAELLWGWEQLVTFISFPFDDIDPLSRPT